MKKFIKECVTGKDNKTPDGGRIVFYLFSIVYCVLPFYSIMQHLSVNCQDWAIGASLIMGGAGALIYLKKDTEPT